MDNLSNKDIVHIKDGNIEYLQFRKLLEFKDKIQHCYTLKGNLQNYKAIEKDNYSLLYNSLKLDYEGFTKIEYQAHSNLVEIVKDKNEVHTNIDGLLTSKNGISLSLRFADCTPILLYDPIKNVVGNIHSGWKGTLQKIAQNGVLKMLEQYNCRQEDIICCIGPCIMQCHFKVSQDVKDLFVDTFSYLEKEEAYIKKGNIEEKIQKYYINTNLINRRILEEVGILPNNIIESNICTVCNNKYMHSYRAEKQESGRNTAIIGLK